MGPSLARPGAAAGRGPAGGRDYLGPLIGSLAGPIAAVEAQITSRAKLDPQVQVLTGLPGVGTLTAMTVLAKIGDITASHRPRAAPGPGRPLRCLTSTARAATGTSPSRAPSGCAGSRPRPPSEPKRPGVRRHLRRDRAPPPRHRHHGDRSQAAGPRLPPAHRTGPGEHRTRPHHRPGDGRGLHGIHQQSDDPQDRFQGCCVVSCGCSELGLSGGLAYVEGEGSG